MPPIKDGPEQLASSRNPWSCLERDPWCVRHMTILDHLSVSEEGLALTCQNKAVHLAKCQAGISGKVTVIPRPWQAPFATSEPSSPLNQKWRPTICPLVGEAVLKWQPAWTSPRSCLFLRIHRGKSHTTKIHTILKILFTLLLSMSRVWSQGCPLGCVPTVAGLGFE